MWTVFKVRMEFITQLCASVPGQSSMVEGWLKSRAPKNRPPQSKSIDELTAEVIETQPEETEAPITLIFQRVNGVLAARMATFKAHLKDCAQQVQTHLVGYIEGEKYLRNRVANGLYWPSGAPTVSHNGTPFVPILGVDGKPLAEPSGLREKAIHIMTPQGPRSALKVFEYIEGAVIEFRLAILTSPPRKIKRGKAIVELPGQMVVNEDDLKRLFLYGGVHGYGGERSEDGGRYAAEFTKEDEA